MTTTTSPLPSATASTPRRSTARSTPSRPSPSSRRFEFRVTQPLDRRHAQPLDDPRASGAPARRTPRARAPFEVDASEPPVLLGHNEAPNPAEYLLHALAGCLTLTIVNVAAARKVTLTEVSSTLEGVLDARGAPGLDDAYRNGFERIRVSFSIKGDAPPEKLAGDRRARARPARSSTTWSPTASRSTWRRRSASHVDGAHRHGPPPAGRSLVASAERLAEDLAARAARARPRRQLPVREHRRAAAGRLLRPPRCRRSSAASA